MTRNVITLLMASAMIIGMGVAIALQDRRRDLDERLADHFRALEVEGPAGRAEAPLASLAWP